MFKTSNWMRTISKHGFLGLSLIAIALGNGCGSDFDAGIVPAGGNISVNGGPATPFFVSNVAMTNQATTVTVTMTNSVSLNAGQTSARTITLVLPNNNIGGNIDLATATGSRLTETTLSASGATLSTDFTSTGLTGTANIQFLTPVSIGGTFTASFTGANAASRAITNGSFVLNN